MKHIASDRLVIAVLAAAIPIIIAATAMQDGHAWLTVIWTAWAAAAGVAVGRAARKSRHA